MRLEDEYWCTDRLLEQDLETCVINTGFASNDDDSNADDNVSENEKCDSDMETGDSSTDTAEGAENLFNISGIQPVHNSIMGDDTSM
jgi:hypothetical protein